MTQSISETVPDPSTLLDGADPSPLFTPFHLGDLELRNRFVMAPMTRAHSPNGVPGEDVAAYYERRARHMGLLVTEGTYIDHPSAGTYDRVPRFYGDRSLDGWRRVVDRVHAVGGRIIPQLWHVGVTRSEGADPNPDASVLSPSGLDLNGDPKGVAAGKADLDAIVESFARAAADAKRIGFDGIELHGAHGYLLDEFLWDDTNRRKDGYGGTPAGRVRLSAEVVSAVRRAVGPDFPISYRFSQWKGAHFDARIAGTPIELDQLLSPLAAAGVSIFNVSTRRYWLPAFDGSDRTLAGWTKHITGRPVIAIGSVGVPTAFLAQGGDVAQTLSLRPLVELFERGEFDLVALGRSVLSDAAWVQKLRAGRPDGIRAYEKRHELELE